MKGKEKRKNSEQKNVRYVFDPQTGQRVPYKAPAERSETKRDVVTARTVPSGTGDSRRPAKKRRTPPQTEVPPQTVRPRKRRPDGAVSEQPVPRPRPQEGFGQLPEQEPYFPEEEQQAPVRRKKKKHPKLRKLYITVLILGIVVILINIAFLYFRGQIWFNEPRKRDYPVRGAVIDSDLGDVDWEIMSTQTISFVYIRATKGTGYVDEQYSKNRKGANKTKLLSGYYHEFDFSRDGKKQAENFIDSLGSLDGKLRPMVKLTRYGVYKLHMKDSEKVRDELEAFLGRIEEEYGRRCVIMCDKDCYEEYVEPYFDKYTLWMIDHFSEPKAETKWALWEFNPRVRSSGYANKKVYYAMTVYRRDRDLENFKKNFLMDPSS